LEDAVRYLCLIYIDEKKLREVPAEAVEAVAKACLDHTEELREQGQFIASERLDSVETATTVRHRDGKLLVTDGPFAETKEQLAGFYLIEARDLNEAIRIASRIPPGQFGSVEVRPVRDWKY
jgi:hypothetical protein